MLAIKMQTVLDHFNDQRYTNSEESLNISVEDAQVEFLPLRSEGCFGCLMNFIASARESCGVL